MLTKVKMMPQSVKENKKREKQTTFSYRKLLKKGQQKIKTKKISHKNKKAKIDLFS